jgi:hypothetical protein
VTLDPATVLGHLPPSLRDELVAEYQKIMRNFREHRWEAAELDGGRFSEIVYTILAGHIDSDNYPATPSKPTNFPAACDALARADRTKFPKSVRLLVPKVLIALYDIRNNRGVGHVGGEVDANHMDATFVAHTASWVMAELVRIFHTTDITTATATVEALVDRHLPLIWEVNGVKRVLDNRLSLTDATLLLLYSCVQGLTDKSLATSLERERLFDYKTRVLAPLHKARKIEYDDTTEFVVISPKGIADVEERLLPSLKL